MNRVLTDRISDILFTTEQSGMDNLSAEGVPSEKICFVGNTMIDSLVKQQSRAKQTTTAQDLNQIPGQYLLGTIHRPSNVDSIEALTEVVDTLSDASQRLPLLLPLHPRTQGNLEKFKLDARLTDNPNITVTGPLGYLEFLSAQMGARVILTDSGGIQEEASYLGIPCLTMRENTERPITIELGTNRLVGTAKDNIIGQLDDVLTLNDKQVPNIPYWDGKAGQRIAEKLVAAYS